MLRRKRAGCLPSERAAAAGGSLGVHLPPPPAWRARVPSSYGKLANSLGLPLLDRLLQRRPRVPVVSAGPLDLAWLAGVWHEVARLPGTRDAGQTLWQHTPHARGLMELWRQRTGPHGEVRRTQAVATALPGSGGALRRMSPQEELLHRLLGGSYELTVLHLDEVATELLLGSPGRDRLSLLSRQPQLAADRLADCVRMWKFAA